ncbi:MAG: hypothetical protein HY332_12380 [Chloroflexi bacterium]|nr:hypothetical protein [Chloroflexota bacterium]
MFALVPYLDYLIVSRFFAAEFVAHQAGRDVGRAVRDFAALSPATTNAAAGAGTSTAPVTAPVDHPAGSAPELKGERLLEAAERLRGLGPSAVVVTEGERGSWCASPEGSFHTPAYPVHPIDTTGAGDVFHGALLFAQARGWSLRRSLRLASAVASLKCRALGGRAGIPTLGEALALMEGSEGDTGQRQP